MPRDLVSPQNSTTVRSSFLGLVERVAPDWLERRAFEAWARPRRVALHWGESLDTARGFHLEAADARLVAWEWNTSGHRGTALLVHGWSGAAAQLRAFVGPLVERGFHVVAVDLPAHGSSSGTQATVLSLADAIGSLGWRLKPQVVVAHSLGATATTLATHQGHKPERLALLAPPVELPPYLRHFAGRAGLSPAMQERLLARAERVLGRPVETLDLRRLAPELGAVGALVAHDVDDPVVPHPSSSALVRAWPGARLLSTSGLGHDRVRRDATVVAAVVEFVSTGHLPRPAPAAQLALALG